MEFLVLRFSILVTALPHFKFVLLAYLYVFPTTYNFYPVTPLKKRESITGIWCYIKNSKRFFYRQKPKNIAQICCKLPPQCTKTIDGCLWPLMDCNLNKVRLNCFQVLAFSFLKCTRVGHELFYNYLKLIEGVVAPFSCHKVKIPVIFRLKLVS